MEEKMFVLNAKDGQVLQGREWCNETTPRGIVAIIHGLGEHSGRYEWLATQFTQAGLAVLAFDLRGHGLTQGPRGHIPSYELVFGDITSLLEVARLHHPTIPIFLYGHSLGGNLVLNYALRCKPKIDGVIASSPGLQTTDKPPAWKTTIGRIMYHISPGMVMDNGLNVNGLSHDPDVIQKYVTDPLVHKMISARLGMDLLDNGAWAIDHANELSIPLLMIQGGSDPIVNPAGTRLFAEKAAGDVTYKEWEGGYHELHNESFKGEVAQTILDWINVKMGVSSAVF